MSLWWDETGCRSSNDGQGDAAPANPRPPLEPTPRTAKCECGHEMAIHEFEDDGAVSCCMAKVWTAYVGVGEPKHCMCTGFKHAAPLEPATARAEALYAEWTVNDGILLPWTPFLVSKIMQAESALAAMREDRDRLESNKWPCGDRPNPCVGHSGDGVNVYGDEESMKKVRDALWYEPQLREHLKAERENLLMAIAERDRAQGLLREAIKDVAGFARGSWFKEATELLSPASPSSQPTEAPPSASR